MAKRTTYLLAVILFVGIAAGIASAQASSGDAARIAKLEQAVTDAKSSADNGWMLTSSALVLLMTGPGLALFYGGRVGAQNLPCPLIPNFTTIGVVTSFLA